MNSSKKFKNSVLLTGSSQRFPVIPTTKEANGEFHSPPLLARTLGKNYKICIWQGATLITWNKRITNQIRIIFSLGVSRDVYMLLE